MIFNEGTQQYREVPNPPNPWLAEHVEWLEEIPAHRLRLFADHSKTILTSNNSPDLPFRWSVNPYRGCTHGCSYCYARNSHEFLGLGAGRDFESMVLYKKGASDLLRAEMSRRSWVGERVVFSGITDPYQPIEASLKLTRSCLEVCEEVSNPVTVITKGAMVERDLDILSRIHSREDALLVVSIPFMNREVARRMEPGAPSPRRRFQVIRKATEAGIPVAVAIAPVIPGLNDMELPGILREARRAGARFAMKSLLRLPGNVEYVFKQRLTQSFPERRKRILSQTANCREGHLSSSAFHLRMKGRGERWEIVSQLFDRIVRQERFEKWKGPMKASFFRRPDSSGQLSLL